MRQQSGAVLNAIPAARSTTVSRGPADLAGHRLFAVVLLTAAALRVVTMLGYRPALLYYGDSYAYLKVAADPHPLWGFQPSGYGIFLWLLRPFHSLGMVAAVQHVLGLGIGLMVYAVLRRRGLPAWGAALAAVPVLFDGQMLFIEHAVLSDTLFIFLIVAAVTVAMWSPRLSPRAAAAAGLLFALAAMTRTIALPVLVLALAVLAIRRIGLRPLLAAALAGGLPIIAYAGWYASAFGRFALAGGDGVALWARTMTFANCQVIRPPANEMWLCPNGSRQDAASEYVWAADSPINRLRSDQAGGRDNALARSFAIRAITAQPLDYVGAVARDVSLAFHWTPAQHPRRVGAHGVGEGRWPVPPPGNAAAAAALDAYQPGVRDVHSVRPYSRFLAYYQDLAYLRGPLLAAILLAGAWGLPRGRTLLSWGVAAALLVLPVAVLDFGHRYVLPVVPVACIAAALALATMRSSPPAGR